jgi:hypothetical protein
VSGPAIGQRAWADSWPSVGQAVGMAEDLGRARPHDPRQWSAVNGKRIVYGVDFVGAQVDPPGQQERTVGGQGTHDKVVARAAVKSAGRRGAIPSCYECIEGTYERPMIAPSLD